MRRADEAERERLHETFATLCRIDSPSGHERPCTDWVAGELKRIGLKADEDDGAGACGADAGNLLTRIRGRGSDSILLCAHLDTVPATAPIEPTIVDGAWCNANPTILGADNKAAVAVMLALAERLVNGSPRPKVGLELLFTVSEENGLRGAKAFDVDRLRSGFGYVFDHATPIGEIVFAAPTYQRFNAELKGRAAHAGMQPEAGRSAIAAAAHGIAALTLGRLDDQTTANIGTISGGTAVNVVPERCRVEGEARGLSDARVESVLTEMIDRFQDAADAAECDLDVSVERMCKAYRVKASAPPVALAQRALRACGYEPTPITTGGGSDANIFQEAGFPCINLANGTERPHQPDERVSLGALEGMLEVAIALMEE